MSKKISDRTRVSIVIPVYNRVEYTMRCVAALAANTPYELYEVLIVDNASTDGTREFLRTLEGDVRVITNPANLGFARACNQGAREAAGEYLLFLNNDTAPQPGWLEALLAVAERDPRIGVVGAKLLFPDDTIQHAGVAIIEDSPYPLSPVHLHYHAPAGAPQANLEREVDAVTGACLLIRRDVFRDVGGFDEGYLNGYEDVDLCLRVREGGHRILYTPASVVYHDESASPGRHDRERENLARLHKVWLGRLDTALPGRFGGHAPARPAAPREDAHRDSASVVIVTRNSLATIAPCLRSILATLSTADEVIVVDNGSWDGTREYLERIVSRWDGVTLRLNDGNLGFSRACNQGIASARGDLVVLLNPDTIVPRGWLAGLASHLRDERVGAVGPVSDGVAGLQKHELYLGGVVLPRNASVEEIARALRDQNRGGSVDTKLLIGFCLMARRRVLEEAGGLDEDLFLGQDDLDLSWRLRERGYRLVIAMDTFVHHAGQASFKTEPNWKTRYLVQQSANILAGKLARAYGRDRVPPPEELWGVPWFTPNRERTSIVIPCYNEISYTRLCVESLLAHTPEPVELIFVDNGSTDETSAYLDSLARDLPGVRVLRNPVNRGFAAACNRGIAAATGDFILLLNNDTVVTRWWLSRLLAAATIDEKIGLVGPRSNCVAGPQVVENTPYGEDLAAMQRFAAGYALRNAGEGHETDFAIGFCLLIKRAVIDRIGGFDTRYGLGNFEDTDFCLRARVAGFRVWICNDVFIHHFGSRTFHGAGIDFKKLMKENEARFRAKWGVSGDQAATPEGRTSIANPDTLAKDLLYQPLGE